MLTQDLVLDSIIQELRKKHRCHTVVLYGSRARGLVTPTSDYDVFGVRRGGEKTRIAKKQDGSFWDIFIYPEKDLINLGDDQFAWKNARVLHEDGRYGSALVKRIQKHVQKAQKRQPKYEIDVTKAWAQKQLDRCREKGIQGLYRRAEFQASLVRDYFFIRQKCFWGPKDSLAWIEEKDPKTFFAIKRALKYPANISFLKAAACRVYKIALD